MRFVWAHSAGGTPLQHSIEVRMRGCRAPSRRAGQLDGDSNPLYAYHLGVASLKARRPAEARAALTAALRLSPSFDGADEARRLLATLR